MAYIGLMIGIVICAAQTLRARHLLTAALWLAASSALLAVLFYALGAHEIAVIELSVGAGLLTILLVFALNLLGETHQDARPLLPRPLVWGLVLFAISLLAWLVFPINEDVSPATEVSFSVMLWQRRGLDLLVQIVLIFAGTLGILGLLSEPQALPVSREAQLGEPKPAMVSDEITDFEPEGEEIPV